MVVSGKKAPGPRGNWLVGDMESYLADRIRWLRTTRKEYGDIVRLAPGTMVVHDPELAHEILARTNDTYLLETRQLAGRRQRAAAQARLDRWMAMRHGMWQGFAGHLTETHLARQMAQAGPLLDRHAGDDRDLVDRCRATTGRLIVDFCVGGDPAYSTLAEEAAARADLLFTSAQAALVQQETRHRFLRRPLASAAAKANAELLRFLGDLIAARRTRHHAGPPRDLLDALLQESRPDDTEVIVSVLRMAMFASHGVPGAALAWIVLRLASDPRVRETVRVEAAACPAGGLGLDRLPLTTAFVRETLRMHPPQWLLTRTAMRRTTIGGYRIRPGQEVLISPYLMHRDERFWPRAERFEPERWHGAPTPLRRHTYLPFGSGPRICPGSRLALAHLTLLTARLAADHVIRAPHIDDVDVTCDGLLLPAGVRGGWSEAAT
ncbi:cytochrome P450 [Streptomyces massasporeus]|uniref:cytochrome P450 n=1 Tax=Streptomyces massasporeus TaxID=67324 RepID=UPI003711317D